MVLPIGDTPNPKGFPFVNYLLIAANVAVFLMFTVPLEGTRASATDPRVMEYVREMSRALAGRVPAGAFDNVSLWDLAVFDWGFRPARPSIVDLFTSMFMHAGFMHLFGNMLFLWIYGDNVEHTVGRFRYLLVYLACGVSAVLFHWAFTPDSLMPMVGASGAISGVLGAYLVLHPKRRVSVLLMRMMVDVPGYVAVGIWFLFQIASGLFDAGNGGGGGVAYSAHVAGFVAGMILAKPMSMQAVREEADPLVVLRRRIP